MEHPRFRHVLLRLPKKRHLARIDLPFLLCENPPKDGFCRGSALALFVILHRLRFGTILDKTDSKVERKMTRRDSGTKVIRETRGSQVAEAALVMPLAFMLLLGIYWFGRAFNTYATINHAAREGARIAVAQTCGTCGNTAPAASNVASTVTQAMQASSVDPSRIIQYPSALPTPANCPAP